MSRQQAGPLQFPFCVTPEEVALRRDLLAQKKRSSGRLVRSPCIEKLIPGDIIDDAVTQCEQTLLTKANVTTEHIKRTVEAFMQYNVTPEMIEAKIQRRIDSITAPQVVQLGKIFNSLRDGMSKPEDWFDMAAGKKDAVEAKTETAESKKKPAPGKATERRAKDKADPATGEVTDQASTDSSPPSVEDWIDDISNAPTAEGVDHKFAQATEQFKSNPEHMASLTLARTQRKQQLAKPEEKPADVAAGRRKLFERKSPEGTAA